MYGGMYGRAMYIGCTLVRTNLCDYLRKKRACIRFVCTIDAYGPLRTLKHRILRLASLRLGVKYDVWTHTQPFYGGLSGHKASRTLLQAVQQLSYLQIATARL